MSDKPFEARTLFEIIRKTPSLKGRGVDSITVQEFLDICEALKGLAPIVSEDGEDATLNTAPTHRASRTELVRFTQLFSILVQGGVPPVDCFTVLAIERAALGSLADASAKIKTRLQEGASLSEAMAGIEEFDELYRLVIVTGRVNGTLDAALSGLENFLHQELVTNQRRAKCDLDAASLDLLRLNRILGLLIKLDVSVIDSLGVAASSMELARHREAILETRRLVSGGKSLAQALAATKQFPKSLVAMTHIGETTDSLDEVFESLARYYEILFDLN